MTKNQYHIVIGGEAGQGLVTIGQFLSKALIREGYHVLVVQDYMSRIRGGHNTFRIQVSTEELRSPAQQIDLLIALNQDTVRLHQGDIAKNGIIIADEAFMNDGGLCVPYKDLSDKRYMNTVALGVAGSLLGVKSATIEQLLKETFSKKSQDIVSENTKSLQAAYGFVARKSCDFDALEKISQPQKNMMINGNEAIALGALSAGLKYMAYYPMTPGTSIAQTIINHAGQMHVLVDQAEDEIAAINMAIGASYAGVPAMVTTSGGGFALMCEGISLAGMTETPVVVSIAQRPGPATGLPTRTEQGDLNLILYSGHGEFPRAIYAPANVDDCYHTTREAFRIAEKYQSPTFILTDQFLADSYRNVSPQALSQISPIRIGSLPDDVNGVYQRYMLTEDGISPRLFPGQSEHLVVCDSDEHTEDGHLTEDLSIRVQMMDKRLKKNEGIQAECISATVYGCDQPDILLVGWGSSWGAMLDSVDTMDEKNVMAACVHYSQVWPFRDDALKPLFEVAKTRVIVEGNATAQFAKVMRTEGGYNFDKQILRYDGLPMTMDYILDQLEV